MSLLVWYISVFVGADWSARTDITHRENWSELQLASDVTDQGDAWVKKGTFCDLLFWDL